VKRQTHSSRWLAALATGIALSLLGAVQSSIEPSSPPPTEEPTALGKPRCAQCGWIESKRDLDLYGADDHGVSVHEYTVRMADGSSREFREADTAKWRLGERLIYIGGEVAAAR
jgi:hypothetical protein